MSYLKTLKLRADEPFLPADIGEEEPVVEEPVAEGPVAGGDLGVGEPLPKTKKATPSAPPPTANLEAALKSLDSTALVKQSAEQGVAERIKALGMSRQLDKNYSNQDVSDYMAGRAGGTELAEFWGAPAVDVSKMKAPDGRDAATALEERGAQIKKVRTYDDIYTDVFHTNLKQQYVNARAASVEDAEARKAAEAEAKAQYNADMDEWRKGLSERLGEDVSAREAKRYLAEMYGTALQPGTNINVLAVAAMEGSDRAGALVDATLGRDIARSVGTVGAVVGARLPATGDWNIIRQALRFFGDEEPDPDRLFDPAGEAAIEQGTVFEEDEERAERLRKTAQRLPDVVYKSLITGSSFNPEIQPDLKKELNLVLQAGRAPVEKPATTNLITQTAKEFSLQTGLPAPVVAGILSAESGGSSTARAFNVHRFLRDPSTIDEQRYQLWQVLEAAGLDTTEQRRQMKETGTAAFTGGTGPKALDAAMQLNPVAAVRATAWGKYQIMGKEGEVLPFMQEQLKKQTGREFSEEEAARALHAMFQKGRGTNELSQVFALNWWANNPAALEVAQNMSEPDAVEKLARYYHGDPEKAPTRGAHDNWIRNFRRGYEMYTGHDLDAVRPEPTEPPVSEQDAASDLAQRQEQIREDEDSLLSHNFLGPAADFFLPGSDEQMYAQVEAAKAQGMNLVQAESDAFGSNDLTYLPSPHSERGVRAAAAVPLFESSYLGEGVKITDYAQMGMGKGFRKLQEDVSRKALERAQREADGKGLVGEEREAFIREAQVEARRAASTAALSAQTARLWLTPIVTTMEEVTGVGGETWLDQDWVPDIIKETASALSPKIELLGRNGDELIYRQEGGGAALFAALDSPPVIGQAFNVGVIDNYVVPRLQEDFDLTREQALAAAPLATALLPMYLNAFGAGGVGALGDIYRAGIAGGNDRQDLLQYGGQTVSAMAGVAADAATPLLEALDSVGMLPSDSMLAGAEHRVLQAKDTLRTSGMLAGMGLGLLGAFIHPDAAGGAISGIRGAMSATRAARRVPQGRRLTDAITLRREEVFEAGVSREAATIAVGVRNDTIAETLTQRSFENTLETITATRAQVVEDLRQADLYDEGLRAGSPEAAKEYDREAEVFLVHAAEAGSKPAAAALDPGESVRVAALVRTAVAQALASEDPARRALGAELAQKVDDFRSLDQILLAPSLLDTAAKTSQEASVAFNTADRVDILLRASELLDDVEATEAPRMRLLASTLAEPVTQFNRMALSDVVPNTPAAPTLTPSGQGDLLEIFGPASEAALEGLLENVRRLPGKTAEETADMLRTQRAQVEELVTDLREAVASGEILDPNVAAGLRNRAIDLSVADLNYRVWNNSTPTQRGKNFMQVFLRVLDDAAAAQSASSVTDRMQLGLGAVLSISDAKATALKQLAADRVDASSLEEAYAFLDRSGRGSALSRFRSALALGTAAGVNSMVKSAADGIPFFGRAAGTHLAQVAKQNQVKADGSDPWSFASALQRNVVQRLQARQGALLAAAGAEEEAQAAVRASTGYAELSAQIAEASSDDWRKNVVAWLGQAVEAEARGEAPPELNLPIGVDPRVFSRVGAKTNVSKATRSFIKRSGFFEAFGFAGTEERRAAKLSSKVRTRRKRVSRKERRAMTVVMDQLARGVAGVTDDMRPAEVERRMSGFYDNIVNVQRVSPVAKAQAAMQDAAASLRQTYRSLLTQDFDGWLSPAVADTPPGAVVTTRADDGLLTGEWMEVVSIEGDAATLKRVGSMDGERMTVPVADLEVLDPTRVGDLQQAMSSAWFDAVEQIVPLIDETTARFIFDSSKDELLATIEARRAAAAAGDDLEPVTAQTLLQDDAAVAEVDPGVAFAEESAIDKFMVASRWHPEAVTVDLMRTPAETAARRAAEAEVARASAEGRHDGVSQIIQDMLVADRPLLREVAEHNLEVVLGGVSPEHLPAIVREDVVETMLRYAAYVSEGREAIREGGSPDDVVSALLSRDSDWRRVQRARDQARRAREDRVAVRTAGEDPGPAPERPASVPPIPAVATASATSAEEAEDAARLWRAQGTESPYFQRWSGGLPVVSGDTPPPKGGFVLQGFHGTDREFDAFDPSAGLRVPPGGRGVYVTPYAEHAEKYAYGRDRAGRHRPRVGAAILPVYVRVRNPLRGDAPVPPEFLATYRRLAAERGIDISEMEDYLKNWVDTSSSDYLDALVVDFAGLSETRSKLFTDALLASGHDGFVLQYPDGSIREVKAVLPNQVKSVYNRGTFSSDSARVLYQKDGGAPPREGRPVLSPEEQARLDEKRRERRLEKARDFRPSKLVKTSPRERWFETRAVVDGKLQPVVVSIVGSPSSVRRGTDVFYANAFLGTLSDVEKMDSSDPAVRAARGVDVLFAEEGYEFATVGQVREKVQQELNRGPRLSEAESRQQGRNITLTQAPTQPRDAVAAPPPPEQPPPVVDEDGQVRFGFADDAETKAAMPETTAPTEPPSAVEDVVEGGAQQQMDFSPRVVEEKAVPPEQAAADTELDAAEGVVDLTQAESGEDLQRLIESAQPTDADRVFENRIDTAIEPGEYATVRATYEAMSEGRLVNELARRGLKMAEMDGASDKDRMVSALLRDDFGGDVRRTEVVEETPPRARGVVEDAEADRPLTDSDFNRRQAKSEAEGSAVVEVTVQSPLLKSGGVKVQVPRRYTISRVRVAPAKQKSAGAAVMKSALDKVLELDGVPAAFADQLSDVAKVDARRSWGADSYYELMDEILDSIDGKITAKAAEAGRSPARRVDLERQIQAHKEAIKEVKKQQRRLYKRGAPKVQYEYTGASGKTRTFNSIEAAVKAASTEARRLPAQGLEGLSARGFADNVKDKYKPVLTDVVRRLSESDTGDLNIEVTRAAAEAVGARLSDEEMQLLTAAMREVGLVSPSAEPGVTGKLRASQVERIAGLLEESFGFFDLEDELLQGINVFGRVAEFDLDMLTRPELIPDEELGKTLARWQQEAPKSYAMMVEYLQARRQDDVADTEAEIAQLRRKVEALSGSVDSIRDPATQRRRRAALAAAERDLQAREEYLESLRGLRLEEPPPGRGGDGAGGDGGEPPTPVTVEEVPDEEPFMAKGMTRFIDDARAIITAFGRADASTGFHEMAHIARRQLNDAQQQRILSWVNRELASQGKKLVDVRPGAGGSSIFVSDDIESVIEAEEMFARAFERYLREGQVPVNRLAGVFDTLKRVMERIYSTVFGTDIDVPVSADMYDLFDELFGAKRTLTAADARDQARYLQTQQTLATAAREGRRAQFSGGDRLAEQGIEETTFVDKLRQLMLSATDYRTRGIAGKDEYTNVKEALKSGRSPGAGVRGTASRVGEASLGPVTRRVMSPLEIAAARRGDPQALAKFNRWRKADEAAVAATAVSLWWTRLTLFGGDHLRHYRTVNPYLRSAIDGPVREYEEFTSELSLLVQDISNTTGAARFAAISRLLDYLRGPASAMAESGGALLATGARRGQRARQNFVNTQESLARLVDETMGRVTDGDLEVVLSDVNIVMSRLAEVLPEGPAGRMEAGALDGWWRGYTVKDKGTAVADVQEGLALREEYVRAVSDEAGRVNQQALSELATDAFNTIHKALTGEDVPPVVRGQQTASKVSTEARQLAALLLFASGRGEVVKDGVRLSIHDLVPTGDLTQGRRSGYLDFIYHGGTLRRDGVEVSVPGIGGAAAQNVSGAQKVTTLLMMGHAGYLAGLYRDVADIGLGLTPADFRAYQKFMSGNAALLTSSEIAVARKIADTYGQVRFVDSIDLMGQFYIPAQVREGLAEKLSMAQRQYGQAGEDRSFASRMFSRMSGWFLSSLIFGNVFGRQAFKLMSTQDLAYQLGLVVGAEAGIAAAARASALTALTALGGERFAEMADVVRRGISKDDVLSVAGDSLKQRVRAMSVEQVDALVHDVSSWMGTAKHRVEVAPILENRHQSVLLGGTLYDTRDLRREFTRVGLYSNAYKEVRFLIAQDFIDEKRRDSLSEDDVAEMLAQAGASDANVRFFRSFMEDGKVSHRAAWKSTRSAGSTLLEHGLESADAWSDLERTGAAVTLVEMGYQPYDAAQLVKEAVYDYRGSMDASDRAIWRKLLMPFWAFRKNANIQFANLSTDPGTVFRMMALNKAARWAPQALTYALYESILEPYDVNTSGMNAYQRDFYYTMRRYLEYGYGDQPPAEAMEEYRAALPEEDQGISDEQLLDYDFNGWTLRDGFKGYTNVPQDLQIAVRGLLAGVGEGSISHDGKLYDLRMAVVNKEARQRYVEHGRNVAVQPGPSSAGKAAWAAARPGVQVPLPVLSDAAREVWNITRLNDEGQERRMGLSYHFVLPDNFMMAAMDMTVASLLTVPVAARLGANYAQGDVDAATATTIMLNTVEHLVDVRGYGSPIGKLGVETTSALLRGEDMKVRIHPKLAPFWEEATGIPLPGEVFAGPNQLDRYTYARARLPEVYVDPETGTRAVRPADDAAYPADRDPMYAYQPQLYLNPVTRAAFDLSPLRNVNDWLLQNWDDSTQEKLLESEKAFQNHLLNLSIEISRAAGLRVMPDDPELAAILDTPRGAR